MFVGWVLEQLVCHCTCITVLGQSRRMPRVSWHNARPNATAHAGSGNAVPSGAFFLQGREHWQREFRIRVVVSGLAVELELPAVRPYLQVTIADFTPQKHTRAIHPPANMNP